MGQFRGKVAWFSERQGFGFITRASGPDVFLHFSALPKDVPATLRDGAEVEFDVSGPDGLHADKVALVESATAE